MKANILEVFQSIQGEGKYAGVKQVFVRFFECNMHCVWCDTPHSIGDTTRNFSQIPLLELVQKINDLWDNAHSVSLTGGEPLLQDEFIGQLLVHLKKDGKTSYLETNGVLPESLAKVIDLVDIIAMDLKLPSSTKCQAYWREHEEFLRISLHKEVFLKTVVSSDTAQSDIDHVVDLIARIDPNILFILQPNYFEMKNGVMKRCLELEKVCSTRLKNVRVIPQIHKYMKLR